MFPKVIFFLGRPGSGKGTQIKLLIEKTGFDLINTGDLLRERAEKSDFIGNKIKETLSRGGLIPTPLVFLIWMPSLMEFQKKRARGIVFDGNPRKLYEACMLEELFEMFGWSEVVALHLRITEEEAYQRLEKRKRNDDNREDIAERLRWFNDDVQPVINRYSEKNALLEINGEQAIKDVWKEIEEKTKSFLKLS